MPLSIHDLLSIRLRQRSGRRGLRKKSPPWLPPDQAQRTYTRILLGVAKGLEQIVKEELIPRLPDLIAEAQQQRPDQRDDRWIDSITDLMARIVGRANALTARAQEQAQGVAGEVAAWNTKQLQRTANATLGIDIFPREPWIADELAAFAKQNADLIKSLPTQACQQIEQIAIQGVRSGTSWRTIAEEIQGRFGATESRAKLIAADQIAKLNGQLTQLRQQEIGVKEYEWTSAHDERVRESHRVLNGKICRWDDPTVYRNPGETQWKKRASIGGVSKHPGQDYRCRCFGAPDMTDIFEEAGIE